ncbi:MAG: PrsW family glutamic-type intramembrane protease [Patescibacteria group bacterium]
MDLTHILYAIFSGIIPALLWLWFWLREDNLHPEPRSVVMKAFIGGMVAIIFVIPLQFMATEYISDQRSLYIVWAFIEEIIKLLAAYVFALRTRFLDEPIDDLIYLITTALGFAAIENTFYIFGILSRGDYIGSIVTGNLRFIGATLVHVVASAIIGYAAARTFYYHRLVRTIAITAGIFIAGGLHALFNLNIMNANTAGKLKVFGVVWICTIIIMLLFERIKKLSYKKESVQKTT